MGHNRNCLIGQKIIYSYVTITYTNKKITCIQSHDVVKIDILTGHVEIGYLLFILKIILNCILIKKNMRFFKYSTVIYESIAYCLTKFC